MKVLELFCGTKSISKSFQKEGHQTFTVDSNPEHNPVKNWNSRIKEC